MASVKQNNVSVDSIKFQIDPVDKSKDVDWRNVVKKQARNVISFAEMQKAEYGNEAKDLFVFVHGYNNTGEAALERKTKLWKNIKSKNVVTTAFNWKSNEATLKYWLDQDEAYQVVPLFVLFLEEIVKADKFESITIVAHSMGNYILTQSVKYCIKCEETNFKKGETNGPISLNLFNGFNIICVAADTPIKDYNLAIGSLKGRVTNWIHYWTASDKALWISKWVNWGKRAGQEKCAEDHGFVESIEWKDVKTFYVNHGYVGDFLGTDDPNREFVLNKLGISHE